jgi:hypothetical protein
VLLSDSASYDTHVPGVDLGHTVAVGLGDPVAVGLGDAVAVGVGLWQKRSSLNVTSESRMNALRRRCALMGGSFMHIEVACIDPFQGVQGKFLKIFGMNHEWTPIDTKG